MTWDFSCQDWVERLRTGRSLVPDLPLNETDADRAVRIFNRLRLPDVPGKPPMAEAAGDWFRDIARAAFGSLVTTPDPDSGLDVTERMVGEVFCLVPKKNSKTTGGAALVVTAALLNKRPNAEILFVGPTQDISNLAFSQARGMIEADEEGVLPTRFHIRDHLKTIEDRTNGTQLRIKTFDMTVMTGVKPVVVIVDELHIMSQFSYASRVLGQIRGGLQPNPESLLIIITTQSDTPPAGVFKQELDYARGVRDGRITGENVRMLPVLYEFPEDMQTDERRPWREQKYWPMVLPNLGRSITLKRLAADYEQAREKGIEEEARWASQHLNIEIGIGLHTNRWRGADYWLACADRTLTLETLLERSEVVEVGGDGGGDDDLLGLAVLGRERDTGRWLLWCHAWCDSDVLKLRPEIAERLRDFERDGDLGIVEPGSDEDLDEFAAIVAQVYETGLMPEDGGIGLDPAGVTTLVDKIVASGVPFEMIKGISQGWRLMPAINGMSRKLKGKTLLHDGSALMAWCVGNARVEQRGNAVTVTKQVSGKSKIDPLIAAFNTVMLMSLNPQARQQYVEVYEPVGAW